MALIIGYASLAIACVAVLVFSIYIFILGVFPKFRIEVNELLSEVFDAAMSDDEKMNLGPAVVIPPMIGMGVMGLVFMVLSLLAVLPSLVFVVAASVFTALRRKNELFRAELEELGRTDLE